MPTEELSPDELSALLTSYMPEIPGYRVLRRIGKGGMSYVYLGVQESLDRQVAIKVMAPESLRDEKSKTRFEQEARTIAKLEHPCIVGIHEVGRTPQGLLYYVLPYLAKGHLGQRDFTTDESRAIDVLRALLSALEYAHARGIVHRDVKAENVLFDNADRPLLTDFGIALSKADTSRITTAGLAVGSGGYMAPEQARGESVDGRADLYSVGVLAFELLTGHLPFLSSDPLALALMHAQDPVPRLPPEKKHWQPFIDRAMAKSPDNRFRNAQQMLLALNQIANKEKMVVETAEATPAATSAAARPWLKPALIGAGVAGVVALSAMYLLANRAAAPRPDFFTGQEPVSRATGRAPTAAPAAAAASTDTGPATTLAPASAPPIAPTPAPVVTGPAADATAFAHVETGVAVAKLDFDPTTPGARELVRARSQIDHQRLSTPDGDNAIESLLAARRLAPTSPELPDLADRVLAGLAATVSDAVRSGRDDAAKTAYRRARRFADAMDRSSSAAWTTLTDALPALLVARLDKAGKTFDHDAVLRIRALAGALEVPQTKLEPAWSAADAPPRPGDVIRDGGPPVVVVRPGLAVMRTEVTRAGYAEFVTDTHRATSRCRNRLAPITIRKRTWDDPGFAQTGEHPVVCVSYDDATAYAQWLSRRTGDSYRLPTLAEWRVIAGYRGSADPCRDGRLDCGTEGTAPADDFPASPQGLHGVRGNAREWLSDCDSGCRRRLVAGLGWRDSAGRADPLRASGFDAEVGFDDTGFRLVREVGESH